MIKIQNQMGIILTGNFSRFRKENPAKRYMDYNSIFTISVSLNYLTKQLQWNLSVKAD
jgi:hypothetical protein